MEDPSEDWRVQVYSSSEDGDRKAGWLWSKGLSLGKKIAVTGVVISSAPLFLPPLVALSAIGVAFSVPVGFACVTYACTEKLVNSLLPQPAPLSPLGWGIEPYDIKQERIDARWDDGVEEGYEENDDIEAEERELEEDTRKGVEKRIELGHERIEEDKTLSGMVDEIVEENVYKEDEEHLEEEKKQHPIAVSEIVKGITEAEEEMSSMEKERDEMPVDASQAVVVAADLGGNDDIDVEQMEELAVVAPRELEEENGRKLKIDDTKEEELAKETTGMIEEIRDEGRSEREKLDHKWSEAKTPAVATEGNHKPGGSMLVHVRPSDQKSNIKRPKGKSKGDTGGSMAVDQKPVAGKKLVVHVRPSGDHTAADVHEESSENVKRTIVTLSDADAAKSPGKRKELPSDARVSRGVGNQEVPVGLAVAVSKHVEAASNKESTSGSDEVKQSEEKIWEKLRAMRTIVGYQAMPRASCVEELKALYIFTGVEPPPPKNSSDAADIDEELHSLMAIVGVK